MKLKIEYLNKEDLKHNNKAMAERFNVSGATIEAITGGRNWKNVN